MKEDKWDIRNIRGVGDRLFDKIMFNFGGEEEFLNAVKNFEVDRISSIEGVSQRRAIEIVNMVLGNPTEEFLKTDRALEIYDDIIEKILQFASTQYGKNRILLLSPSRNELSIKENIDFVMKAKETVGELPINEIKKLLIKINTTSSIKPKYNPSQAILVESMEDYHRLIDLKLNSYCPIITIDDLESLDDFEFIVYVYGEGVIELEDAFNVTMVNHDSQDFEIVPDVVLDYFKENYDLLSNISKIKEILGLESILPDVLDVLDELESGKLDENIFDQAVEEAKGKADLKLKNAIKNVDLKGDEVLDLLNEEMPVKIQHIFDDVMKEARNEVKEKTGFYFDPFIQKYPIEVDMEELERIKKQEIAKKKVNDFENEVKAAVQLSKLKIDVINEIREIFLFDYEFALGCFAREYDLQSPKISTGFCFKDGLHLNLALDYNHNIQKIDYALKSPNNVVLLTGANSGGKTTLLETFAQISIMAQMGLPVCAYEARVQIVDEVYFFSKKRSLDAGAFESFLNTFMPIVT